MEAQRLIGNVETIPRAGAELYGWAGSSPNVYRVGGGKTVSNLSGNRIRGGIPTEIGRLSVLHHLLLSSNNLSKKIPTEMGNLTALQQLDLGNNTLAGAIPTELGNLKSAHNLCLDSNSLSGPVVKELCGLPELVSLSIKHNRLSGGIPTEIASLTRLSIMDLATNQLTGPIPSELGALSQIQYTLLADNSLSGAIPAAVLELPELVAFAAQQNRLIGPLPFDSLAPRANPSALLHLNLGNNSLTGVLPSSLCASSLVTVLLVNNNLLRGSIPSCFGSLRRLRLLALNHNRLSGPVPSQLCGMRNLSQLYLGHNSLTQVVPPCIWDGAALSQLRELNLESNRLEGTLPSTFSPSLRTLELHQNRLNGEVPPALGNYTPLLATLTLDLNRFSCALPMEVRSGAYAPGAEVRVLTGNQFACWPQLLRAAGRCRGGAAGTGLACVDQDATLYACGTSPYWGPLAMQACGALLMAGSILWSWRRCRLSGEVARWWRGGSHERCPSDAVEGGAPSPGHNGEEGARFNLHLAKRARLLARSAVAALEAAAAAVVFVPVVYYFASSDFYCQYFEGYSLALKDPSWDTLAALLVAVAALSAGGLVVLWRPRWWWWPSNWREPDETHHAGGEGLAIDGGLGGPGHPRRSMALPTLDPDLQAPLLAPQTASTEGPQVENGAPALHVGHVDGISGNLTIVPDPSLSSLTPQAQHPGAHATALRIRLGMSMLLVTAYWAVALGLCAGGNVVYVLVVAVVEWGGTPEGGLAFTTRLSQSFMLRGVVQLGMAMMKTLTVTVGAPLVAARSARHMAVLAGTVPGTVRFMRRKRRLKAVLTTLLNAFGLVLVPCAALMCFDKRCFGNVAYARIKGQQYESRSFVGALNPFCAGSFADSSSRAAAKCCMDSHLEPSIHDACIQWHQTQLLVGDHTLRYPRAQMSDLSECTSALVEAYAPIMLLWLSMSLCLDAVKLALPLAVSRRLPVVLYRWLGIATIAGRPLDAVQVHPPVSVDSQPLDAASGRPLAPGGGQSPDAAPTRPPAPGGGRALDAAPAYAPEPEVGRLLDAVPAHPHPAAGNNSVWAQPATHKQPISMAGPACAPRAQHAPRLERIGIVTSVASSEPAVQPGALGAASSEPAVQPGALGAASSEPAVQPGALGAASSEPAVQPGLLKGVSCETGEGALPEAVSCARSTQNCNGSENVPDTQVYYSNGAAVETSQTSSQAALPDACRSAVHNEVLIGECRMDRSITRAQVGDANDGKGADNATLTHDAHNKQMSGRQHLWTGDLQLIQDSHDMIMASHQHLLSIVLVTLTFGVAMPLLACVAVFSICAEVLVRLHYLGRMQVLLASTRVEYERYIAIQTEIPMTCRLVVAFAALLFWCVCCSLQKFNGGWLDIWSL
ncbi:hypothetical protein CYMTET_51680 [Cymbomonas tetramitiformis]|uniref:Uncharacterized protein n=1 Tax=Cymbomonas tetramitiformis TaxID=36881 RepID=A0AAE0BM81_9CHLO|nr:hypothetical protein CYMTET_51680 [Cymbomonas tetramitiformis]